MGNTAAGELAIFCENMRLLRQHYGYSKKEMAKISGISTATLTKLEQTIIPPKLSVNVVFKVAWHFKLKPYQMFRPLKL
ncbi:MAG: helix-turn-helix domain-containing protein [Oscillospiraceae bacterium]|jgi:DNA-binding XRE family transcriptional regulator